MALGACAPKPPEAAPSGEPRSTVVTFARPPVVLVRSGWRSDDIGNIAQTPGLLRLLGQYLSEGEIILWSNAVDRGVEAMLRRYYPKVRIVQGDVDDAGQPESPPLKDAFERADFLLHGSGPGIVARRQVEGWRKATGKPYGFFGVSFPLDDGNTLDPGLKELLEASEFVFTRETTSMNNVVQAGVRGTRVAFAPDATFSINVRDDETARAFLTQYELPSRQFLIVVPRLRYRPYDKLRDADWTDEQIRARAAANNRHAESDHAKLREAIVRWVRGTGWKVLLCAQTIDQLDILNPLLSLPLPEDVGVKVVSQPHYWLADTAAAVYRRAAVALSLECESGIIAAANDTPSIHVHQPEEGPQGQAWKDIGLTRWFMDIEATGAAIAEQLMGIQANYVSSEVQVHEAVIYARSRQAEPMRVLRNLLGT